MSEYDGLLALLTDIKDMLFGICLLVLGCFLLLFGLMGGGILEILIFIGSALIIWGIVRTIAAFTRHEVGKKQDN